MSFYRYFWCLKTAISGPWEVLEKSLNFVLWVCYEPCLRVLGYVSLTVLTYGSRNLHICIEIMRVGCEGIGNMAEYQLRREWRVQVSPSRQQKIASLPIPNSIFFWRKGGPQTPHQTCVYGTPERPPVSPVLRVAQIPTFKRLASSLLWDFYRCFHSEAGSENEKLSLMLLVLADRYSWYVVIISYCLFICVIHVQMLAKFAEDDRIEQMNAQKRRMKHLEHQRAVEQMLEEQRRKAAAHQVCQLSVHCFNILLSNIYCSLVLEGCETCH